MEFSEKNRDAITRLARSSDAQKLMELLQKQSGQVKQAAQQAAAILRRTPPSPFPNSWKLQKRRSVPKETAGNSLLISRLLQIPMRRQHI